MKIEKTICLIAVFLNITGLTKGLYELAKNPHYIISFFVIISIIGLILSLIVLTDKE